MSTAEQPVSNNKQILHSTLDEMKVLEATLNIDESSSSSAVILKDINEETQVNADIRLNQLSSSNLILRTMSHQMATLADKNSSGQPFLSLPARKRTARKSSRYAVSPPRLDGDHTNNIFIKQEKDASINFHKTNSDKENSDSDQKSNSDQKSTDESGNKGTSSSPNYLSPISSVQNVDDDTSSSSSLAGYPPETANPFPEEAFNALLAQNSTNHSDESNVSPKHHSFNNNILSQNGSNDDSISDSSQSQTKVTKRVKRPLETSTHVEMKEVNGSAPDCKKFKNAPTPDFTETPPLLSPPHLSNSASQPAPTNPSRDSPPTLNGYPADTESTTSYSSSDTKSIRPDEIMTPPSEVLSQNDVKNLIYSFSHLSILENPLVAMILERCKTLETKYQQLLEKHLNLAEKHKRSIIKPPRRTVGVNVNMSKVPTRTVGVQIQHNVSTPPLPLPSPNNVQVQSAAKMLPALQPTQSPPKQHIPSTPQTSQPLFKHSPILTNLPNQMFSQIQPNTIDIQEVKTKFPQQILQKPPGNSKMIDLTVDDNVTDFKKGAVENKLVPASTASTSVAGSSISQGNLMSLVIPSNSGANIDQTKNVCLFFPKGAGNPFLVQGPNKGQPYPNLFFRMPAPNTGKDAVLPPSSTHLALPSNSIPLASFPASNFNNVKPFDPRLMNPPMRIIGPITHPAPLPQSSSISTTPSSKLRPPMPTLSLSKNQKGIVLSWDLDLTRDHESITVYELYAYQESIAQPHPNLWKKVGDVKPLPLPMACTLNQFVEGKKYHFAIRALDKVGRCGPFSMARTINLIVGGVDLELRS